MPTWLASLSISHLDVRHCNDDFSIFNVANFFNQKVSGIGKKAPIKSFSSLKKFRLKCNHVAELGFELGKKFQKSNFLLLLPKPDVTMGFVR